MGVQRVVDWRDAELAAAEWMRAHGWPDAYAAGRGADNGLDVISGNAVAQVKWHSKPMGRPDLQKLVGATWNIGATMLAFSRSGFTAPAIAFAEDNGVGLFVLHENGRATVVVGPPTTVVLDARKAAQDPRVTALDESMLRLSELSAHVVGRIERMERQSLGWTQRRRLEAARKKASDCAPLFNQIQMHYSARKWRKAQVVVGRAWKALSEAEKLLN